jgi:serine/threonine protein phosphatase PrpC
VDLGADTGLNQPVQIEAGAASDTGRVRESNEDAWVVLGHLFAVADGMGGHAAGEVASELAVAALRRLADRPTLTVEDVREALAEANRSIVAEGRADRRKAGLGTTVSGIALVEADGAPHWLVFNVGDSRVYRIEGDTATQLTVDHSEVEELVAAGLISPEEAQVHPLHNVITRSLGMTVTPEPDVWLFPVQDGDAFVACTDGLTNEVDDAVIGRVAAGAGTAQDAADALVAAAVDAGGRDNVTVVAVRLASAAPPG